MRELLVVSKKKRRGWYQNCRPLEIAAVVVGIAVVALGVVVVLVVIMMVMMILLTVVAPFFLSYGEL